MSLRVLRSLIAGAAMVLLFGTPAFAQDDYPELEVNFDILRLFEETAPGFHVDIGKAMGQFGSSMTYGVVGEFGWYRMDGENLTSLLGGIRINPNRKVFVQALAGVLNEFGTHDFTIQPGGGLRFPWNDRMNIKVGADAMLVYYNGNGFSHWYKGIKGWAGIELLLGK